jgi:excisionase family DNA binding protein
MSGNELEHNQSSAPVALGIRKSQLVRSDPSISAPIDPSNSGSTHKYAGSLVYLTAAQVAELLQLDTSTVYRLASSDPSMPATRVGNSLRFHAAALERWLGGPDTARPAPAGRPLILNQWAMPAATGSYGVSIRPCARVAPERPRDRGHHRPARVDAAVPDDRGPVTVVDLAHAARGAADDGLRRTTVRRHGARAHRWPALGEAAPSSGRFWKARPPNSPRNRLALRRGERSGR